MDVPYKLPSNTEFETSYVVFKASRGCLAGEPIEGEHQALGPYRMGPSPAYRTFASDLCDVSTDHKPNLIEWGTDVHLNHPITAH